MQRLHTRWETGGEGGGDGEGAGGEGGGDGEGAGGEGGGVGVGGGVGGNGGGGGGGGPTTGGRTPLISRLNVSLKDILHNVE